MSLILKLMCYLELGVVCYVYFMLGRIEFLYIPRSICVIQPDTQCFMSEFIHNTWWLGMFWTSVFHPQERLQAVRCRFGMW